MRSFGTIHSAVPVFKPKEMLLISILLCLGGYCFIQSFRTYQHEFDMVFDDLFALSQLHGEMNVAIVAKNQSSHNINSQSTYQALLTAYDTFLADYETLMDRREENFIHSFWRLSYGDALSDIARQASAYRHNFQEIRKKHQLLDDYNATLTQSLVALRNDGLQSSTDIVDAPRGTADRDSMRQETNLKAVIILKTLLYLMGQDDGNSLQNQVSQFRATEAGRRDNTALPELSTVLTIYPTMQDLRASLLAVPYQTDLQTIHGSLRKIQEQTITEATYFRTLTYFIVIVLVLYISLTLIRHYAQQRRRAEESSAAKSDFLANMSHEIRTPLNGIIGMVDLLRDTPMTSDQKSYFRSLNFSAETLTDLINDILDISKIESGNIDIETIRFHLPGILKDIIDLLTLKIEGKDLQLTLALPAELNSYFVGDPTRLRQVLMNLIGNACKFTDKGHIKVSVSKLINGMIRFEIEDTGIGIPPSKSPHMFKKFSQGDQSTTRKYGGSGLGLAICKNLVTLMQGDIGFYTNQYGGTTFWFELPLKKLAPEDIQREDIRDKSVLVQFEGKRVLLAEDNRVNYEYASKILRDMQIDVVHAMTGTEVVSLYKQSPSSFHLILMDCRMPEMDGYEATIHIRHFEKEGGITPVPILALTANAIKGDAERCRLAGMDDYLTKPLRRHTLEKAILRWFSYTGEDDNQAPMTAKAVPSLNDNNLPALDAVIFAELQETMADSLDLLIDNFQESVPSYLSNMKTGLASDDRKLIIEAAHPLKSSSAALGLSKVAYWAGTIEACGHDGADIATLKQYFSRLEPAMEEALTLLQTLKANDDTPLAKNSSH